MRQGYIAVHRKMLDNPIVCKDTEHMAVWMYLLLNATHTNYDVFFKGNRITLQPGQLLTGRKSIAKQLKVNESKVQRILKLFESEQQIEQQTSNQNRLISIVRWTDYQKNGQQTEQQMNNKRTTDEQQMNTNNNVKKVNNDNKDIYPVIIEYLNNKTNKDYKHTTKGTRSLINARINEGFSVDDFKIVIDTKAKDWKKDVKMNKYLRPQTLFSNKFESYLNETHKGKEDIKKIPPLRMVYRDEI